MKVRTAVCDRRGHLNLVSHALAPHEISLGRSCRTVKPSGFSSPWSQLVALLQFPGCAVWMAQLRTPPPPVGTALRSPGSPLPHLLPTFRNSCWCFLIVELNSSPRPPLLGFCWSFWKDFRQQCLHPPRVTRNPVTSVLPPPHRHPRRKGEDGRCRRSAARAPGLCSSFCGRRAVLRGAGAKSVPAPCKRLAHRLISSSKSFCKDSRMSDLQGRRQLREGGVYFPKPGRCLELQVGCAGGRLRPGLTCRVGRWRPWEPCLRGRGAAGGHGEDRAATGCQPVSRSLKPARPFREAG